MEKDKKIIIISKTLQKKIKTKDLSLKHDVCFTSKKAKEIKKQLAKQGIQHILIYDETHSPKHKAQEKIPISDHINKTGENSLIPKQETEKFIDLCFLYQGPKTKNITTSLGKKYEKYKKTTTLPSTTMSLMATVCRAALPKAHIKGFLINYY